jgi:hypothetical protein
MEDTKIETKKENNELKRTIIKILVLPNVGWQKLGKCNPGLN